MSEQKLPANVVDSKDRIIKKLSSENTKLREQISQVMERVRANENIWSHFSEIEDIVYSSAQLPDMMGKLIRELKSRFNLDSATILLTSSCDGTPEYSPVPLRLDKSQEGVYLVHEDTIRSHIHDETNPLLLTLPEETIERFFFPDDDVVNSAAIVPLELWGGLLGTLNMGSKDADRYRPDNDTSFLRRLATKLSIGVSNLISRDRLEKLSITDSLTGLYNRRYMEQTAQAEFERAARYGATYSCMVIDLDGFKKINDEFGHETGDKVLVTFSEVLKQRLRVTDTCARLGGDEFCVLLPETGIEGATATARKLVDALENVQVDAPAGPVSIKASFGCSDNQCGWFETWEDILKEADRNMYEAKKLGGGRVYIAPQNEEQSGTA